jgi:hypothetical protein
MVITRTVYTRPDGLLSRIVGAIRDSREYSE